jgi:hypothetical protein
MQFYSARAILFYLQIYNFVTFKLRSAAEQMPVLVHFRMGSRKMEQIEENGGATLQLSNKR